MIYHDTGPTAKTRCAQQLCGPARRKAAKKLRWRHARNAYVYSLRVNPLMGTGIL